MRVLVVNAGSSSLKLRVLDDDEIVGSDDLAVEHGRADTDELAARIRSFGPVDAVGHRVVHGAERFVAPVVVDDDVLAGLDALVPLDPLHQPVAVALIRQVATVLPGVPAVACFDTSFHTTLPPAAATFALPGDWRAAGVRRYGFHGLSHAWASRRAATLVGRLVEELAVVTCHLGAGASLAAVQGGRCVDTTMGFTPLDGLVMATRPGGLDPGVVLWAVRRDGVDTVERALYEASGLVALAGTPDMAEVRRRADRGDADAVLARAVYVHHLRASIGAMVAALGRLDALVFTGGVGERDDGVRAATAAGLGHLGLAVDPVANVEGAGDRDIGAADAPARILVVEAREDLEIARATRQLLQ